MKMFRNEYIQKYLRHGTRYNYQKCVTIENALSNLGHFMGSYMTPSTEIVIIAALLLGFLHSVVNLTEI